MSRADLKRRTVVAGLAASAAGFWLTGCGTTSLRKTTTRANVVVIGGGFAGATSARLLRRLDSSIAVTLVEPSRTYTACPLSNLVIAGWRDLSGQQFRYAALAAEGIQVVPTAAVDVDPVAHQVTLQDGNNLPYDRLIMAPGVDLRWDALPGYDVAAAEQLPHAWQAGAQTLLLKKQLEAMNDGGVVAIVAPDNPYRCPPGPYERASVIAHYLKTNKPRSKLLILDAKDRFSKQALFQQAWKLLYGDLIEWAGLSDGARVVRVDAATRELYTDFDTVRADVANVIPPQRAGLIAERAGVSDASGWCPIKPASFESRLQSGIHVLGDAAIANAMPKSAFAANAQAKLCAVQVVRMLNDHPPLTSTLINTCYSYVAPDYGISITGVYRPGDSAWLEVEGSGGVSPLGAPAKTRALEAGYAGDWYRTITAEVFG